MKLLSLSWFFEDGDGLASAEFKGLTSALDYDAVFWHPGWTRDEYESTDLLDGYPTLTEDDSAALNADIARRKKELELFLALGRTYVVILTPPVIAQLFSRREYSGTGRNARRTDIFTPVDILSVLPFSINSIAAQGSAIELTADEPYAAFWRSMRGSLRYSAYLETEIGKPLFRVAGTGAVVGAEVSVGPGRVLLLPEPKYVNEDDPDEERRVDAVLLQAILDLVNALTGVEEIKAPDWVRDYSVGAEKEIRGRLREVESQLGDLAQRRDEVGAELAATERLKRLLTDSGRPLERSVRRAFETLGATTEDGSPARTDFVIHFEGRTAVAEVKGVTKSAKEQDGGQLEKWVIEHWERDGERPKGLLIVNAFREQPIKDRDRAAFPNQMLKFCEARDHCLMTTTQLLGAVLDARLDPSAGAQALRDMFETIGVYKDYSDWTTFIDSDDVTARESEEPPA